METIPWYKSAILRQQVVQLLTAGTAILGAQTGTINLDDTVGQIFAAIGALVAVWTIVTRYRTHSPNLTATAAAAEQRLVEAGKIPGKQAGFFRPGAAVLAFVLAGAFALALGALSGCQNTKAAYQAANSLPDTAYVVTEHYAAVVHEAAEIAALPTTPPEVKAALKQADARIRPLILGDPQSGAPGVRQLAERYAAVKDAKSAEELQRAIDAAVLELAKLINAVKAARS